MHPTPSFRPLAAAVLCAAALPLAALLFFHQAYQTNDDVAMRLLAEGNFVPGSGPLPFLMHMNIVIGKLLTFAYALVPALPWYDLLLGASMTAAAIAFLWSWCGLAKSYETAWAIVFAAFFLLPAFVIVQFSLAGLGCAGAGIVLIVRAGVEQLDPRVRSVHLWLGAGLFVLGALIRGEGAALMAVEGIALALPLAAGVWWKRETRPAVNRAILAAGAAVVLAMLTFGIHQFFYARARGWSEFYEYNVRRSRVAEYLSADRVTPAAIERLGQEVGWSANDFLLFRNWFFTDRTLFSLDRLRRADALLNASVPAPENTREARLKRGVELARGYVIQLRWAVLIMALFVVAWGARLRLILYFVATCLTIAAMIVGISIVFTAPPERIHWPMMMLAASMLPIAARRLGRPAHPAVIVLTLLAAAYVTGTSVVALHRQAALRRAGTEEVQRDVAGLRRTGATLFVLHGGAFPYEDFWQPLRKQRAPFPFVGLGVSARTPPVQDFLSRTGLTDLPRSLCSDRGLVIVAKPFVPSLLMAFSAEHHKTEVHYEAAFTGKRFTAWKCVN